MHEKIPVTEKEREYDESQVLESITDLQGVIEQVNDAFCEVSGYRREELLGHQHHIVRHPDMPDVVFEDLWLTLREGGTWRAIVKNRCKNGDYFWADETIVPLYKDGKLCGYRATQTRPSQRLISQTMGLYRHLGQQLH